MTSSASRPLAFAILLLAMICAGSLPASLRSEPAAPGADTTKAAVRPNTGGEPASGPRADPAEEKPGQDAQVPQRSGKEPVAPASAAVPVVPAAPSPEAPPGGAGPTSLTVASWGGAYGRSQEIAYFRPFERETGTKITSVVHGGREGALEGLAGKAGKDWDVVDLGSHMLERACADGRLEALGNDVLAYAGDTTAPNADFLPGAVHKCGLASVAWSSVIVFDTHALGKRRPSRASDFFDLETFPGKRALRAGPKYTLELALMAAGVAPPDVYGELTTEAGLDRAFAMLDRLKDNIVWWTRGHEPLRLLANDEVTMATAFNGRVFYGVVAERARLGIIWDGQIYDTDHWAIPKASANKSAARAFIAFALRPDRLAAQAQWLPYGPMRKSALSMVAKHAEADVDMKPFLPTASDNFRSALKLDETWWADHGPALSERFEAWRSGAAGVRVDRSSE